MAFLEPHMWDHRLLVGQVTMLVGPPQQCGYRHLRKEFRMLFSPAEKGQGLVEYAIIIALVAIVVVVVVGAFGSKTGDTFSAINNSVP